MSVRQVPVTWLHISCVFVSLLLEGTFKELNLTETCIYFVTQVGEGTVKSVTPVFCEEQLNDTVDRIETLSSQKCIKSSSVTSLKHGASSSSKINIASSHSH